MRPRSNVAERLWHLIAGIMVAVCWIALPYSAAEEPEKDPQRIISADEARKALENAKAKGWEPGQGWGGIYFEAKGITLEAAQVLGKHKGRLVLKLDELPEDAAKALSSHQGDLMIELKGEITEAASDAFRQHVGSIMSVKSANREWVSSSSFKLPLDSPDEEAEERLARGRQMMQSRWLPLVDKFPEYRDFALKQYKTAVASGEEIPDSQIYETINFTCIWAAHIGMPDEEVLDLAKQHVRVAEQTKAHAYIGIQTLKGELSQQSIKKAAAAQRGGEPAPSGRKIFEGVD